MIDRKRFTTLLGAQFAAAGAVGSAQPARAEPYKIGMTFPQTGPLASVSIEYIPGAQIAADDVNRSGGVKGHPLQIVVEDTQSSPQGGVAAMRKLVQVDGVQAIITIYTNVVTAQMPLADQLNHDLTHLQGQRVEGMLARLVALVMTAPTSSADAGGLARGVGPARPTEAVRVSKADPRRLGVHAAISAPGVSDEVAPEYVPRDVDAAEHGVRARVAAAALRAGFVLLVLLIAFT